MSVKFAFIIRLIQDIHPHVTKFRTYFPKFFVSITFESGSVDSKSDTLNI